MKLPQLSWRQIPVWFLLISIGVLGFSYRPLIRLGVVHGVHIDLALIYVVWVLTVLLCLATIWQRRKMLLDIAAWRLLVAFSAWMTLTIAWSPNQFRAVVTSVFMWLIISIVSLLIIYKEQLANYKDLLFSLITTVLAGVLLFSLWQIFGDSLGVSRSLTLLPADYTSSVFGVARPTGFSLEPQFLASILLIPYLWGVARLLRDKLSAWHLVLFVCTVVVLILTLSRGGLLAAGFGTILLFVSQKYARQKYAITLAYLLIGISSALLLSYTAAAMNTRDSITGYSALRAQISQLSLGHVELPAESHKKTSKPAPASMKSSYVATSTSSRVEMTTLALLLWKENPAHFLFGVGVGGFGTAVHQAHPSYPATSVVNNHYIETLAETGLVGFLLFIAFFGSLFYSVVRKRRHWFFAVLLAAFLVQWLFFSGSANVLHVWVAIGVLLGLLRTTRASSLSPKTIRDLV